MVNPATTARIVAKATAEMMPKQDHATQLQRQQAARSSGPRCLQRIRSGPDRRRAIAEHQVNR